MREKNEDRAQSEHEERERAAGHREHVERVLVNDLPEERRMPTVAQTADISAEDIETLGCLLRSMRLRAYEAEALARVIAALEVTA
jgi:hypothetical protein